VTRRARPRVGLFIAGGTYAYQMDIIYGVHEECERRGLDLVCLAGGSLGCSDARSYVYGLVSPSDLDAAILVPGTWGAALESAPVRALLETYLGLPACIIGARHGDVPSVCIDNESGVADITRHLIERHGRRRIAFISGYGSESRERQRGYERALREAGIGLDRSLVYAGDYTGQAGAAAAAGWCASGKPACDAIVAANDWMALGALELLQQAGVRVPEDIALVGFDDVERVKFISPPLTTIRQSPHLLAVEAVTLISGLLAAGIRERHVAVATAPQIRRSCGCFGHVAGTRRDSYPAPGSVTSLLDARGRIAAMLTEDAGPLAAGLGSSWAEELIDALLGDLGTSSQHGFLECLGRLIACTAELGNITAWHRVVSQLRRQAIPCLVHDLNVSTRAEELFGLAYIAIGERAEAAQMRLLVEREDLLSRLGQVSRAACTVLDWPALCRVLSEHLPGFRVPSFYVARGDASADANSRLIYAFQAGAPIALPDGGIEFRTGQIIAPELCPQHRTSLVTHALYMGEEILGHCCMEIGPRSGSVLRTLGELVGSALKAFQLSAALVAEVTRRERAERTRLLQEFEIAARIQTAILPRNLAVPGLEVASAMRPASEVGGDYFDVLPRPDGCWIGIGDVAGHGLPAGLVMLMIQSIVAATVHDRPELQPKHAWQTLNTILSENIRERMQQQEHATLCLIRYHESGRLRFAGAHEDLIVYRTATASVECVRARGLWAGILREVADAEVEEGECQLDPGDLLVLHTDGVVEALSPAGEMYGMERLLALITASGRLPVQTICDRVLQDVTAWMQTQDDDITLIVARHLGDRH
jgi:sigma-B regulation protein RsbU (phosphoserine phosphatase)